MKKRVLLLIMLFAGFCFAESQEPQEEVVVIEEAVAKEESQEEVVVVEEAIAKEESQEEEIVVVSEQPEEDVVIKDTISDEEQAKRKMNILTNEIAQMIAGSSFLENDYLETFLKEILPHFSEPHALLVNIVLGNQEDIVKLKKYLIQEFNELRDTSWEQLILMQMFSLEELEIVKALLQTPQGKSIWQKMFFYRMLKGPMFMEYLLKALQHLNEEKQNTFAKASQEIYLIKE